MYTSLNPCIFKNSNAFFFLCKDNRSNQSNHNDLNSSQFTNRVARLQEISIFFVETMGR